MSTNDFTHEATGQVNVTSETKTPAVGEIVKRFCRIALDKLKPYGDYPRLSPEDGIDELASSMGKLGQSDCIQVVKDLNNPGYFWVLDGWRRVLGGKKLGWEGINCYLLDDMNDREQAEFSVVRNVNRKSYTAIETAYISKTFKQKYGFTGEQFFIISGVSKERQSQLEKLLTLDPAVRDDIQNGVISSTTGVAIARLSNNEEQIRVANLVKKHGYSAQQVKSRVDRLKARKKAMEESEEPTQAEKAEVNEIPGVWFESSVLMSDRLEPESVHLILTSPPYGMDQEFEKGFSPTTILEEVKPVLDECEKVLCPGGFLVINVMNIQNNMKGKGKRSFKEWLYNGVRYQNYLRSKGLILRDVVTWNKKNLNWAHSSGKFPVEDTPHTSYRLSHQTEEILIFQKNGERIFFPEAEQRKASHLTDNEFKEYGKSVWDINIVRVGKDHPCVFPEELCRRVIKMYSFIGDTVVDPFLGSGTTVKVARELGRDGNGFEKDSKYKPIVMKKLGLLPEEKGEVSKFIEETMADVDAPPTSEPTELEQVAKSTPVVDGDSSGSEMGISA